MAEYVQMPDGPALRCDYEIRVTPIDHRRVLIEQRQVPGEWEKADEIDLLGRNPQSVTVVCPVRLQFDRNWQLA